MAYAVIRRGRKLFLGMLKNLVRIPTYGLYADMKMYRTASALIAHEQRTYNVCLTYLQRI